MIMRSGTRPLSFSSNKPASKWLLGLACLLLSVVAHASSSNWWVDIANDRVDQVKTALAQGEDPNAVSPGGQPAIMQAIRDGAWGVYDLLAAHRKIDVNAANKNDETPLMYLAIVGDTKRAQALIKKGAKVNRLGWTPLQYAASKGQADMVKLLISNKAIVDAPAPDGTTALMMAAFSGSEKIVRQLLDAGAEVTTQNLQKQDAADWARSKNNTRLAEKLDELTQKKMKERAAMRARGQIAADDAAQAGVAGGATVNGHEQADVKTVNVQGDDAAVPPSLKQPEQSAEQPEEGNSTSRYFDLDRFK